MTGQAPFWKTKSLSAMTRAEWESLCDGCGKCCVHKLEDEKTGELLPTNVACRLLDRRTGRCRDYRHRQAYVPECVRLTPEYLQHDRHSTRLNSCPLCASRIPSSASISLFFLPFFLFFLF